MSNRIFRMWPALALALLLAAVWHWGTVPESALAQSPVSLEVSTSSLEIEEGSSASYRVRLSNAPSVPLFVAPVASDSTVVSVGPSLLEFTPSNWSTYQTVYLAAKEDAAVGVPEPGSGTVSHESSDSSLEVSGSFVSFTVSDDDMPGVILSKSALMVDEGDAVSYLVSLRSSPVSGDVVLSLSSVDVVEDIITVRPTSLTFTDANWNVPQTVLVRGVRDDVADGAVRSVAVRHMPAGGGYAGLTVPDVPVSVRDDDVKGFVFSADRLAVQEGGISTYDVRLSSKPNSDVAVAVTSSDVAKATVSQAALTFTPSDWKVPQTVVVSGVDDGVATGIRSVTISHRGSGGGYDTQRRRVAVGLANDDSFPNSRVVVHPAFLAVDEGTSGSYGLRLSSRPAGNVVVELRSGDRGVATVSPSSLTFTPDNWMVLRTVEVTGAEDRSRVLGDRMTQVTHSVSGRVEYYVSVVVRDDDADSSSFGVTLSPSDGLTIAEGSTGTYTVSLTRRPTGSVRFDVASSDPSAVSVSPPSLTFTESDWSVAQTINVRSLGDQIASGDAVRAKLLHRVSGSGYDLLSVDALYVKVIDDDQRGVSITPTLLTLAEGASGSYSVVLESEPFGDVSFRVVGVAGQTTAGGSALDVSVTGDAGDFAAWISRSSLLTFTSANWRVPQTVRVHAGNDGDSNGTRAVVFDHDVSGGGYVGHDVESVTLLLLDDDRSGLTISDAAVSLGVGEKVSYRVWLNAPPSPSASKTINLESSIASVAAVSPPSLTFDADNWNVPSSVFVTGVAGGRATVSHKDGDGALLGSVFATVRSGAGAGVTIRPASLSVGVGGNGSYSVVLDERPAASVTVTARSDVPTVATVFPDFLVFTPDNWSEPQYFSVDGIRVGSAVISHVADGAGFSGTPVGDLSVSVSPDTPVVQVSTTDLSIGVGGKGVYRLTLESGSDATVTVTSSDISKAVVSHSSVGLTSVAPTQSVQVTGVGAGTVVISHSVTGGGSAPVVNVAVADNAVLEGFDLSEDRGDAGARWAYVGDDVDIGISGSSGLEDGKVWVYRVLVGDGSAAPLSCDPDGVSVLQIAEADYSSAVLTIEDVQTSLSFFELGANYLCVADADGNGTSSRPLKFTLHEPPDTYRVWLKDAATARGGLALTGGSLPDGFRVLQGRQSVGANPWQMPQYRGIGAAAADALTETSGALFHCEEVTVADQQVGCEWEESARLSAEPWRVGYEAAGADDGVVQVPGDELSFRVDLVDLLDGRGKARIGVFWGPVDLWRLDADVYSADFAIHEEHTLGLVPGESVHFIEQSHLTDDGFYEFTISRHGSSNMDGRTFVALVRCNDDLILGVGSDSAEVQRNRSAFPDCSVLPANAVNFEVAYADPDDDAEIEALRLAWAQHNVISGRGMTCEKVDVTITRTSVPDNPDAEEKTYTHSYARAYDIDCHNDVAGISSFTQDAVAECDANLRKAATDDASMLAFAGLTLADDGKAGGVFTKQYVTPGSPLYCGFGPPTPFVGDSAYPWGSARYNAARSFYGFVIDWQSGFGGWPSYGDGCIMLLPHSTVRHDDDTYSFYGERGAGQPLPYGTERWLVGDAGEFSASDGADTADLCFLAPEAHPDWDVGDKYWYDDQRMHFAVYMSGMPVEHDVRVNAVPEPGWRRVSLGSWDWGEADGVPGNGARRRMGRALPTVSASDLSPPAIHAFHPQSGYAFSVSRDYADAQGRVHLYIVPCLPWGSMTEDPCADLAEGTGSGTEVRFQQRPVDEVGPAASSGGPFGVYGDGDEGNEGDLIIWYSQKAIVSFGNVALGKPDDRPVSFPRLPDVPKESGCVVRRDRGFWPERLVQGGGCSSNSASPVDVVVKNSRDTDELQNFVVYATGGRSDGLDLVNMRRFSGFGSSPVQLARLGLLERVVTVPAGAQGEDKVVVTPDMAGGNGNVYLLFYECGGGDRPLCARNSRGSSGDVPHYNVPADPAFVVRVDYTASAGLVESGLGLVCQGYDCEPLTPFLRAEVPSDGCKVQGYSGGSGVEDLTYLADRVISGGACSSGAFEPITVTVENPTAGARRLVVYSTGGRGHSLDLAQVRRYALGWPGGYPAGKVGLQRDFLDLAAGATGSVTVDYSMTPDYLPDLGSVNYRGWPPRSVLLLAYACEAGVCPDAVDPTLPTVFAVDQRPLFEVIASWELPRKVLVAPNSLSIAEGESGTYTVVLGSQPTGEVFVTPTASPSGSVTFAPAPLVFDPLNWYRPQTVTVTSEHDDDVADDSIHVAHLVSGADYGDAGLCPAGCPVSLTVIDDDTGGAVVSERELSVREDSSVEYSVTLAAKPSGPVTITPSVSPVSGVVTVSPVSLTFTPVNWDLPQMVTVSGVGDAASHDPLRMATISHSASGVGYDGVSIPSVVVTVLDVDLPGISPSVRLSDYTLTMAAGDSESYTLVLGARPSGDVTITLSNSDVGTATALPASLTFTADNWSDPQTVTVDGVQAGKAVISHNVAGGGYESVRIRSVVLTVTPGASVKGVALSATSMSIVVDNVGAYTAVLTAPPAGDVTLTATSGATGVATVAPASWTFSAGNWDQPRTFRVSAVALGSAMITHTASGGDYGTVSVPDMGITVVESGTPGGGLGGVHPSASVVGGAGSHLDWRWGPDPLPSLGQRSPAASAFDVSWTTPVRPGWLFQPEPLSHAVAGFPGALPATVFGWPVGAGDVSASEHLRDRGWQWLGDYFNFALSGFSPNQRVWAYRLVVDAGASPPTDCRTDGRSSLPIATAELGPDGSHVFANLLVSADLFEAGEDGEKNYVCAADSKGLMLPQPKVLTVYDPPDVYRMQLTIHEVERGALGSLLAEDFQVIDGQHYQGASDEPWAMPQYRGQSRDDYLTRTQGNWQRCFDGPAGKVGRTGDGFELRQVGCDWDDHDAAVPGEIGMVAVAGEEDSVQVPGDDVEFRIGFHPTQFSGREQERFAIFWGPVDLWLLGAPGDSGSAGVARGSVSASDYVIHKSHLDGLESVLVTQLDLDDDGYYTLSMNRDSSNARGDTFVAVVPCNEDYLGAATPGTDLWKYKLALPDCSRPLVPEVNFDVKNDDEDEDEKLEVLRLAWQQHDVTSGLGMSCDVEVKVTRERDLVDSDAEIVSYTYDRSYDVRCENDLPAVTAEQSSDCDAKLRDAAVFRPTTGWVDDKVKVKEPYSGLRCGWGPLRPFLPDADYWATTKYNAARSIYGFVVDWYRGGGNRGGDRPGCSIDLLRYRETADGERVSVLDGQQPVGTRYWRLGTAPENDVECLAGSGVDELDVEFFTAKADPDWSDVDRRWHGDQAAHFALYVSGLSSEHDYRAGDGVGNGADDGWRRVALGAWDWRDGRIGLDGGLHRPLGMALPQGGSDVSLPGDAGGSASGLSLAKVSEFYDGNSFTVSRDLADRNGVVRLYVVPCLPNYAYSRPELRVCRDLGAGAGHGYPLEFRQGTSDAGPFGLETTGSGQVLHYSYVITVTFDEMTGGDRPVSIPSREVPSSETACEVARHRSGHWVEALVSGGACDRDDLSPVNVSFRNEGSDDARLAVYVTGGRSHGLDLVEVMRASRDADGPIRLGRLGLLERADLSMPPGGVDSLMVSPDMANSKGEVWLLVYRCEGSLAVAICPRSARGAAGEISGYDMEPAVSMVVLVRFTGKEKQLEHTSLGQICQGSDCDPPAPEVLREALPDLGGDVCGVSSYDGGRLWPDRLVRGGDCAQEGTDPVAVKVDQPGNVRKDLVVFATGGRTPGWESIQVNRGDGSEGGVPAGAVGLRRVELSASGQVLVDPDLADDQGRVLLLAYLCSDSSDATQPTDPANCPSGRGDSLATFDVSRRPLFQVLVEYDAEELVPSGFAVCRGDSCSEIYELERFEKPSGPGCSVSASYSGGKIYWPDRVVAGGSCDRRDLDDVTVTFSAASSSSEEHLMVYVTGGRSPGLETVNVRREEPRTSGGAVGRFDVSIPFPEDVDVNGSGVRASLAAVTGVLDGKDWVHDGLTAVENRILDGMRLLAGRYEGAERVAAMPFLDTVDDADYLTIMALVWAAKEGVADDIVEHSVFDGDIDDDERFLVIGASQYSDGGVAAVTGRLDDGEYDVEMEEFSTADRPNLVVWVARDEESDGAVPDAADLVKASVESMEEMMGRPFPISHVVMFLDSGMFPRGSSFYGFNYGGVVFAVRPDLEHHAYTKTIIHEVAHYYWYGARIWIDEGMADTAVAVFGPSLKVPKNELLRSKDSCGLDNLSELDVADDPLSMEDQLCPYKLGQALFLDLRETLGVADFRAGVRRLYDTILAKEAQGVRRGYWANVDDLREAFSGNAVAQEVIDRHWFPAISGSVVSESPYLGRMGLRQETLTIPADGVATVSVSPDLAWVDGHVWLLAYRCDSSYGDSGCPVLSTPVRNGYDLPKGPDFAVRVKFTEEAGLEAADLQRVCVGMNCDFYDPWLRQVEPSVDECEVQLGAHWDFWPDRVVRGGGCYFRGAHYGSVDFRAEGAEKFVVYTTGGVGPGLDLVPVYGVLGKDANAEEEQLGRSGLRETQVELAPGGEEQVWVRSGMADDDGNVWLFVYRCLVAYGDAGCPLVGRDAIRPAYDVPIRPAFVVRVGFLRTAVLDQSSFVVTGEDAAVDCPSGSDPCKLTAIFRDSEGNSLPGTVEFRVDRGSLGATGSTATSSRRGSTLAGDGEYRFEETLHLPSSGGVVNIQAEFLGDGLVLWKQAGSYGAVDRISVRVMRCSGDDDSCHDDGLEEVDNLLAGDHFVLGATGYDAAGNRVFDTGRVSSDDCVNGPTRLGTEFKLKSDHMKSHVYGVTTQPNDRGYVGCAIRVSDDAPLGTYNIAVSYGSMTVDVRVVVGVDTSKLGYLVLSGKKSQLKSGESDTYRVVGLNLDRLPMDYDLVGGCLKLTLSGALEVGEGGSASSGCISDGLPKSGVEFTVQAKEDVVYQTDSSVGVSYGDIKVSNHVMVVPAEDDAGAPVPSTSSHISNLTISQEGGQLSVTWNGSPQADFKSLRAQVWVTVGGEDVFLPGCQGGEVHAVDTQQVFCLLSYGQSEDVYHAAVGFIRYDNSAVPVETTQWTRP